MSHIQHVTCASAAALVGAILLAACTQVAGPTLTVSIEGRRLEPSSTVPNAATLCCCVVKGNVRNTSSIPIHVEARFFAKNPAGETMQAVDWVPDVPAGATKPFAASGFLVPCGQVSSVQDDPLAFGVFTVTGQ
jgi:hypothetical protein